MFKLIGYLILLALIILGAWWLWENVPQTHAIYDWVKEKVAGASRPRTPGQGS